MKRYSTAHDGFSGSSYKLTKTEKKKKKLFHNNLIKMNINKRIMVPTETYICPQGNGFIKNENGPCLFTLDLAF